MEIELFDNFSVCKQMTDVIKSFIIHSNTWNLSTLFKQMINSKYNYSCLKYLKPFNCVQKNELVLV